MSENHNDQIAELRHILQNQFFMVLATEGDGKLHASLLAFAATPDLKQIVFATPRASRKFNNIRTNQKVALLIDTRSNDPSDLQRAVSITVHGVARETGPERRELLDLYCRKHPGLTGFAGSDDTALISVQVIEYDIVSGFQNMTHFIPPEAPDR
jgi:heme iron utilization protein